MADSNLVARLRSHAGMRPRDYDCQLTADAAAWIERLERYNADLSDTVSRCASLLSVSNADAVIAGIERLRAVALAAKALVQTAHDSHHDGHTTVDEPALTALESALEAAGYGMTEEEAAEMEPRDG